MRGWRVRPLALVIAMLLAVTLAGPVLAATPRQEGQQRGLFGPAVEINLQSGGRATIGMETSEGVVTVQVTEQTSIKIPGVETATVGDIRKGDFLVVLARSTGQGLEAVQVMVKPDRPVAHTHIVGVVVAKENGQITVVDASGREVTVNILISVDDISIGQALVIVVQRDPATGKLVASHFLRATQIIERLDKELQKAIQERQQALEQVLKRFREQSADEHLAILNRVREMVQDQARDAIQRVLQEVKQRYEEENSNLGLKAPAFQVTGTITVIDPGRITVTPEDGEPVEVTLSNETEIGVQGEERPLGPRDLALGQVVTVWYNPDTGAAKRVTVLRVQLPKDKLSDILREVSRSQVEGRVSGINIQATPPTITITPLLGANVQLRVTGQTQITVDGQSAILGNLTLDSLVKAEFYPDTREAMKIAVFTEIPPGVSFISGVVSGLVKKAGEVTITTQDGKRLTLRITGQTVIERNGQRVPIQAIQLGDQVKITSRFRQQTLELLNLSLRASEEANITGLVTGKSTTGGVNVLTIATPRIDLVRLIVTNDTQLTLQGSGGGQGRAVSFQEIDVDWRVVQGTFNPTTNEALRLVFTAPVVAQARGEVRSVNPPSGLTVAVTGGGTITLTVNSSTRIQKNGDGNATLTDIQPGDLVTLALYNPQTNVLLNLVALTPRANQVSGQVTAVNTSNNSLTIAGATQEVTLTVTGSTRIVKNQQQASLSDIAVGDRVTEAFYTEAMEALRIVVIGLPSTGGEGREVTVSGVIRGLSQGKLNVDGREIVITSTTRVNGTPRLGLPVEVKVRVFPDGRVEVLEVTVKENLQVDREVTFRALVISVQGNQIQLEGRTITIGANTLVEGELRPGVLVEVKAVFLSNGDVEIRSIKQLLQTQISLGQ